MSRSTTIALFVALLVGMTVAAYVWMQNKYAIAVDIDFKAIGLVIAAITLTLAAGMFVWRLMNRSR